MGYLSALDMREYAGEEQALYWHLRHNHFPPIPEEMITVAKQALQCAREDNWSEQIELPEGASYHGKDHAPVAAVIRALHLDAFLERGDSE